jgi:hypothetical protein
VTSSIARTVIRKLGRNRLGVALSLSVFAFVIVVLWHLLRDVDIGKLVAALAAPRR